MYDLSLSGESSSRVSIEDTYESHCYTPDSPEYPDQLSLLNKPPKELYHLGQPIKLLKAPIVAVVGSRKATRYGLTIARSLGRGLAQRGISVCSGLALGIDGACHRGVIDEMQSGTGSGPPIGVLGHGWGKLHPRQHRELALAVMRHGMLFTEYAPGSPASRYTFPARNRIIAALSDHVVIVEAGARSGSLHTAEFALDLGKTVWAVPNGIGSPNSQGVLTLIKEGAQALVNVEEFLESIAPSKRPRKRETWPPLSSDEQHLLVSLADNDGQLDHVCESLDWSATELAYRLTGLELQGLVGRAIDGTWQVLCWELVRKLKQKI